MRSAAEYKEILARFKKEFGAQFGIKELGIFCLLYTSPSPRDRG